MLLLTWLIRGKKGHGQTVKGAIVFIDVCVLFTCNPTPPRHPCIRDMRIADVD